MRARLVASALRPWAAASAVGIALLAGCSASTLSQAEMFSMHVESLTVDPRTSSPVVLLEELEGEKRKLPIWIGVPEARSIAIAMERVAMPRPNTHDLIKSLLDGIEAEIERVVITELRESTYFAVIEIAIDGRTLSIDSRPSDAIAVAIRTGSPLFATAEVLRQAEENVQGGDAVDIDFAPDAGQPARDVQTH